ACRRPDSSQGSSSVEGGCYWLTGQSWQTAVGDAKIRSLNPLRSRGATVSGRESSWWRARPVRLVILTLAVGVAAAVGAGCGGGSDNASSEAQKRLEQGTEEAKKGIETAKKEINKGFE